ncbi:MAG: hypothetical protein LJE68_01885 [Rhodobacter sp.]|nr:hypothetical protein [Rhodobacter sp.]
MINPYAQTFMIAARTQHLVTPQPRDTSLARPSKPSRSLFRRIRPVAADKT